MRGEIEQEAERIGLKAQLSKRSIEKLGYARGQNKGSVEIPVGCRECKDS